MVKGSRDVLTAFANGGSGVHGTLSLGSSADRLN